MHLILITASISSVFSSTITKLSWLCSVSGLSFLAIDKDDYFCSVIFSNDSEEMVEEHINPE